MAQPPSGTVTFLFTDIEASTSLWQEHPDAMSRALATHDRILRSAIGAHAGYVFSSAGDSIAAAFPRAADALSAAVAAQRALGGTEWGQARVKVRMALHTGEAEERSGDYFGQALSRAARLMAAGHGGQVLASLTAAQLVADELPEDVRLMELGEHRLKDLSRPEQVFQVCHPDLTLEFPPLRTLDVASHNLPVEATSFIGRSEEVGQVATSLGGTRLITLTGVGGVGKTRVALQVAAGTADRFPDGVWLAELGALTDPGLVAKQVAVAIGVQEQADRPILATLLEALAHRDLLLLLDNCEHVVEAAASLAHQLLRTCPGVRILATSREPLGVSGEMVWKLRPMPLPSADHDPGSAGAVESVGLFVDRARLADREFSLTSDNVAACAEICRRLDGVPLAIELAAATVSALSPQQIAERLDDRLALLVKGSRSVLPRQQTLRAAIAWSYDLLAPDEARLLRILSVFRGGFTLDAVEAVLSDGDEPDDGALRLLTGLVDKSLVVVDSRVAARRFGLLETIRQYAREMLEVAGEAEAALARHRRWFASWAADQGRLVSTPGQLRALDALEADHDNLRAVLERSLASGDAETALRVAADISYFWWLHSHFGESGAWFERLLAIREGVPPRVRAKLLIGAGEFSMSMSDHRQGKERLTEARRLAAGANAPHIEGWALAYLMTNEAWRMNPEAARAYGEQGLEVFREAEDRLGGAYVAFMLTALDWSDSRLSGPMTADVAERLVARLEPMVAEAQQVGERNLIGHLFEVLGAIAMDVGRVGEASSRLSEALDAFSTLGNQICLAHTLDRVALLGATGGHAGAAVCLLAAATALRQRLGVSARAIEQSVFDEAVERCREQLTSDEFEDRWADGATMARDGAVQHARAIVRATAR